MAQSLPNPLELPLPSLLLEIRLTGVKQTITGINNNNGNLQSAYPAAQSAEQA